MIKRDSQYQLEEVLDWAAHLEHLQAVLQEFDPAAASNGDILIQYFREGLRPYIRAQLDVRDRELDSWEEAIEKAVDAEAKALLQPPSGTREIDAKCLRGYRPAKKEDKDSGKNNSVDILPADVPSGKQTSFTHQKKDQNHQGGPRHRGRQGRRRGPDSSVTGVNITSEKEEKDISYIECFHCRRKGHFANKCPQKKNQESED